MNQKFFVTGIGTEVGKTIASAILVEALQADYWKPIQAGDLENSDTHKIKSLVSNNKTIFHANSFALKTPMSPHAAAKIDGVKISSAKIEEPESSNHLVIEGAGGLLVPISDEETIADLMQPDHKIVIVSRHYLGSINHTLLTFEALKRRKLNCFGIIFNGNENPSSEEVIQKMTGVRVLGRIGEEEVFTKEVIQTYAAQFRKTLLAQ